MTSRYEELLLPEQRDRIVGKVVTALKTQGQLPSKTLNEFRDLFKAGKPIPGFKDPLRAMPPLLKQQLLERLEQNPDIEGLVVGTWADIEPQLLEAVSEHVGSLDPQAYVGDDLDEEFWDAQVSLLAEKHGSYDENDILLMTKVCYMRANLEASPEGAESERKSREPYPMETALDAVLESLGNMPAASPQWRESIPQFVESVEELIKEKNQELVRVEGITSDLTHIQSVFQTELAFFSEQDEEWDAPAVATLLASDRGVDEASQFLSELKDALTTYRRIKDPAGTLSEERERREKRHELEEVIEGKLREIDEISRAAPAANEVDASEPAGHSEDADAPEQITTEADTALLEDIRVLRDEHEVLAASNRELSGEVVGLRADKQVLADEVAELRDQLRISEISETNWRNAYEAGMSSEDSPAPEPIPAEVESVNRALELAKARYSDKLVYWPNKKSDPDYNYRRPKEVWDALEWLATTYYEVQTGKERVIDLNESIRNTCGGWEYKANQTDITFNVYREWYITTKDRKVYELREHLAKGTGRDANVIRIAFAWDEDSERVIVGYVGPHQRNRAS
ncbi:MAG: hypothetical protein OXD31_02940 [Chloroflexi bacterium]|nr:hypothetical protein [Chloroflexota bacterium]